MEMRVSSYRSREELERYCRLLDPEQKRGLEIVGTTDELARFQLGPSTSVYGVPCRATDAATTVTTAPADRGRLPKVATAGLRVGGEVEGYAGSLTDFKPTDHDASK